MTLTTEPRPVHVAPTANRPQQVVAFAGDWHGDFVWATGRVMSAAARGITTIFHVGDFGIWPGPNGKKYLLWVEKACAKHNVTILVTPGNHEDWDRINTKQPKDRGDGWGAVQWLTDHIGVLPRGHRFTMTTPHGTTRSFVSLGGAPSIDFEYRTEGRDWWPAEMITDEDVEATIAGGHAEVMIAHDSPDVPYAVGGVATILATNPLGWSRQALSYAARGRARMHRAYEAVAPRFFFHGHYHVAGANLVTADGEPERWVISLDMQGKVGNTAYLNLDTLDLA